MNTNNPFKKSLDGKTLRYALPFVVVIAVLLAFSSPAAADYSGDHPLVTYDHDVIHGGIVYETVTDGSGYTTLYALGSATYSQDITIHIPKSATVKMARLYNYYTWSKSDGGDTYTSGDPAEADLAFNGVKVTCQNPSPITNPIDYGNGVVQYWDTKGPDYECGIKYDFPSGTFAWDVTGLVTGSGTYTATITNADSSPTSNEYFATYGFGLLVVYETPGRIANTEYWIDEGCDLLLNTSQYSVYEPIATTNAPFPGYIEEDNMKKIYQSAELTTVVVSSDKGSAKKNEWAESYNMNYFNSLSNEIGPSTAVSDKAIGLNYYDVLKLLQPCENIAYFQDRDLGTGRGDNEAVSNAFLVIKKK
jgi:hypothetical protein